MKDINQYKEVEELNIKLPKQVMDLLRVVEHLAGITINDYIINSVLQNIIAHAETNILIPNQLLLEKFNIPLEA